MLNLWCGITQRIAILRLSLETEMFRSATCGIRSTKTSRRSAWRHAERQAKQRGLMLCLDCAEEDRQTYGEPYWHLVHQIPEVHVCPKHRAFLVAPMPQDSRRFGVEHLNPVPRFIDAEKPRSIRQDDPWECLLLALAEDAAYLLEEDMPPDSAPACP
jgi:hypothetical protein